MYSISVQERIKIRRNERGMNKNMYIGASVTKINGTFKLVIFDCKTLESLSEKSTSLNQTEICIQLNFAYEY